MEVNIKTSWEEVTVGEYQQLHSVFNSDSDLLQRELLVLEILTDKTYDELLNLRAGEVKQLLTKTKFLGTNLVEDFRYEYHLGGDKYIPRLIIEDFEAGRFIDIQAFLDNPTENLHMLTSIILDKQVKNKWFGKQLQSYDDKDIKKLAQLIQNEMPITQVNGLTTFFLKNYIALLKTIEDSSEAEMSLKEMITKQMKGITQNTGDGLSQSVE